MSQMTLSYREIEEKIKHLHSPMVQQELTVSEAKKTHQIDFWLY